jgi:hypothetical protein
MASAGKANWAVGARQRLAATIKLRHYLGGNVSWSCGFPLRQPFLGLAKQLLLLQCHPPLAFCLECRCAFLQLSGDCGRQLVKTAIERCVAIAQAENAAF